MTRYWPRLTDQRPLSPRRSGVPTRCGPVAKGPERKSTTAAATASGRSRSIARLSAAERTTVRGEVQSRATGGEGGADVVLPERLAVVDTRLPSRISATAVGSG